MKSLKEQIEVMQHFLNGGEIEAINEHVDYWYDEKKPNWDWNLHDYRIKEYTYPMYFECISNHCDKGMIVKFTSLEDGELVKESKNGIHKMPLISRWEKHTYKDAWKQVEKPKDKIVIEKWLNEDGRCIEIQKDKLIMPKTSIIIDTYEVEV